MKKNIQVVRESIGKIVALLTRQAIKVTQRGTRAYVSYHPKTGAIQLVNIPYLPDDASDGFVAAVQGFLDHEVGHVLDSDPRVLMEAAKAGKRLKNLHNIIEDCYIERRMAERFPGSQANLEAVRRFYLDKIAKVKIDEALARGDTKAARGYATVVQFRAWAGQRQAEDFLTDNPEISALLEPTRERMGPDLIKALRGIKNSAHALELARQTKTALEEPPTPGMSGAPDEDDEPEDPSKGDDGSAGPSWGAPDEPGKDEGAEPPPEPVKEGATADDSGKERDEASKTDEASDEAGDKGGSGEDDKTPAEEPEPAGDEDPTGGASPSEDEGEPSSEEGEAAESDSDDGPEDDGPEDDGPEDDGPEDDGADEDGADEDGAESDGGPGDAEGAGAAGESEGDEDDGDEDDGDGSESGDGEIGDEEGDEGEGVGEEASDHGRPPEPGAERSKPLEEEPEPEPTEDLSEDFDTERDFDEAMSEELSKEAKREIGESSYQIFSTDWDVVEFGPAARRAESVERMVGATEHMISGIQKSLERAMAAKARKSWNPGQRRGRIAPGALFRTAVGDERVFRQRYETQARETAVSLLVDCSGSMRWEDRIGTAGKAAYALASTLERLKIKNEVLGFTTRVSPPMVSAIQAEGMGMNYSREEALYIPIFKSFNERLTTEPKMRLAHLIERPEWCRENVDGESLQIAAHRLVQQRAERHVLIVLSDGNPACAAGDSGALHAHLKKVAKELNTQIECIGIGIQSNAVKSYYGKCVVLNDLNELPTTVVGQLAKVLLAD